MIGDRLGPRGDDALPWDELRETDAVYFTAGDAGARAPAARAARVLVATARGLEALAEAGVELDALVASARTRASATRRASSSPAPRLVVRTAGAAGGAWETAGGDAAAGTPTPPAGPVSDAYGCGDSFAAGLYLRPRRGHWSCRTRSSWRPLRRRVPHRPRPVRGPAHDGA